MVSCSKSLQPKIDSVTEISHNTNDTYLPPGTIQVSENVFIDERPVTNLMYKEFLRHQEYYWTTDSYKIFNELPKYNAQLPEEIITLQRNGRVDALSSLLDPSKKVGSKEEEQLNDYLKNVKYTNSPALQIDYDEAVLFCKWRSELATLRLDFVNKTRKSRVKYPKNLNYRLLNENEFVAVIEQFNKYGFVSKLPFTYPSPEVDEIVNSKGSLVIYDLLEVLNKNQLFNPFTKSVSNDPKSETTTSFRCICETEDW